MRTALRFLVTFCLAGLGLAAAMVALAPEVGAVFGGHQSHAHGLDQLEQLSQRSVVLRSDGKLLAVLHAEENRSPVKLAKVPDHVVNAIVDMEDERFWQHGGVDLRSTTRALFTNVSAGRVQQGGSTITQQLVKNALLTPERSVDRKVKEAVLAVRLEKELGKPAILERYLNTVYFGNGSYGVQAAAETYFGKDVGKLSIAEGALLAGLIRNPVGYDPFKHQALARARRDLDLERMVTNGHLTAAEATKLKETPLPAEASHPLPAPNDYFVEEVKQRLLDDPRLGETAQERYNAVFKGGLKIYTTLDGRMQELAQQKVNAILPRNDRFTAALVTVEPKTGAVKAMVGGVNFEQAKFNLVTQGLRQPGSSFKPFVLIAAFENGYGPRDSVNGGSPCVVKQGGGRPWVPGNYEGTSGGVMSLSNATAHSVNCAFVRLGLRVGLQKVADVAKKMGITTHLDPYPAMSLGSEEVHPLDMASAFGVIANDGVRHAPRFVEKVVDRKGHVIFEGPDKGDQVIKAQIAREAIQVMRPVVEYGTAVRARLPGRQVAGKTGTSQNYENAWFVGFTPQLATAVWMGAPKANVPMHNVGGIAVVGGSYPARIWGAFMNEALEGQPSVPFPLPDPKQIPRSRFITDPPEARGGACSAAAAAGTIKPKDGGRCVPGTATTIPDEGQGITPATAPGGGPTTTLAGNDGGGGGGGGDEGGPRPTRPEPSTPPSTAYDPSPTTEPSHSTTTTRPYTPEPTEAPPSG